MMNSLLQGFLGQAAQQQAMASCLGQLFGGGQGISQEAAMAAQQSPPRQTSYNEFIAMQQQAFFNKEGQVTKTIGFYDQLRIEFDRWLNL